MLVDVTPVPFTQDMLDRLAALKCDRSLLEAKRLKKGIYQNRNWSFPRWIQEKVEEYPDFTESDIYCYGVCDGPDQFVKVFGKRLRASANRYAVSMVQIRKADQSSWGGWRWHKWGPYVGEQTPTREYLYDEPDIDEVWTFHIYQVLDPA